MGVLADTPASQRPCWAVGPPKPEGAPSWGLHTGGRLWSCIQTPTASHGARGPRAPRPSQGQVPTSEGGDEGHSPSKPCRACRLEASREGLPGGLSPGLGPWGPGVSLPALTPCWGPPGPLGLSRTDPSKPPDPPSPLGGWQLHTRCSSPSPAPQGLSGASSVCGSKQAGRQRTLM